MTADPFSDILQLANARSVITGGFTAGGAWAIRFPAPEKIKFFAVVKGQCWLRLDGLEAPVRVAAGDVLLLAAPRSFVLAGDLAAIPVEATALFPSRLVRTARLGETEDCVQIGGHVQLDPASGRLLADVLPPLIHVQAASPQATVMAWLLDQLVREQAAEKPGASAASAQLAQLLFIQILRVHLASSGPMEPGLLRAISDPRIAPALRLMHGDPGRCWRLGELAKASAMSRTSFAQHFKEAAGVAPLSYLRQWRMRLAAQALREGNSPVSTLAQSLGYGSDSAFSNAFKRSTGSAPRRYRTTAKSAH